MPTVLVLLQLSVTTALEDVPSYYDDTITSLGTPSCGAWTKHGQAKKRGDNVDALMDRSWLVGYLSGMSTGRSIDALHGTDYDSLVLWMDNYCDRHPLERISKGADELWLELADRRTQMRGK